ncbi:3-oxoacyl-ACP reductase family protein [Pseudomonas oryzihabitans]|uniref:3-oxoacyl-ACP reductase family protein n=1 Tax=Pseudomonas oryzihabitans TaxID=47885 RepID=UPI00123A3EF6|nr:3-oxoacyl-ACP reductase family protein [Pseudomonas oryzihabitans]QEU01848.1 3-oxoacyl-ACP reductase FabG [Pseudomonas oryzihabitans]
MDSIENKVALVTGASRGIGREAALSLARAGCDVAVNCIKSIDEATQVVAEITALGGRACVVQADVTQADQVVRMAEEVEGKLGAVSILVNNAGVTRIQPLDQITEADWNQVMTANLTSTFLVSQAVLPAMRKAKWGRLIMLSSVAAQLGGVIGPHYAASKAGMIGLVHSYAHLLAKEGITANAIAPALIETDMIRGNPNIRPDLLPVGRFGQADEVAETVVLLARNGYMTGQTLNINGGWYMS